MTISRETEPSDEFGRILRMGVSQIGPQSGKKLKLEPSSPPPKRGSSERSVFES